MLVFDLRSLAAGAVHVDDVLALDDPVWGASDPMPAEPVHVTGRLSPAGGGGSRYYFSGRVSSVATDACRRCLSDVETAVDEPVRLLFLANGETGADDPDVFVFDPRSHELDLRPAVREQWVLSVPRYVVCRDDCKGLCPTCGSDLNAAPCGCPRPTDDRWATLRSVHTS